MRNADRLQFKLLLWPVVAMIVAAIVSIWISPILGVPIMLIGVIVGGIQSSIRLVCQQCGGYLLSDGLLTRSTVPKNCPHCNTEIE